MGVIKGVLSHLGAPWRTSEAPHREVPAQSVTALPQLGIALRDVNTLLDLVGHQLSGHSSINIRQCGDREVLLAPSLLDLQRLSASAVPADRNGRKCHGALCIWRTMHDAVARRRSEPKVSVHSSKGRFEVRTAARS